MNVSVGIFVHNEERLVEQVVLGYLAQTAGAVAISEIIVLSCASTDATDAIVARLVAKESRLQLVRRPVRLGKVAAMEDFAARAGGDVLVCASGDVVPGPDLVEQLIRPLLLDPNCGMTGPRVRPRLVRRNLTARMHSVLWLLHHHVCLQQPKLGEVIAIRACHLERPLPTQVHCDEVLLEASVLRSSATLRYVPTAYVANFAPRSWQEFFAQRRRIACQHTVARHSLGYAPASARLVPVLGALAALANDRSADLRLLVPLLLVEAVARSAGRLDYWRGRRYSIWDLAERPPCIATEAQEQAWAPT